jgi:hypothetical protein
VPLYLHADRYMHPLRARRFASQAIGAAHALMTLWRFLPRKIVMRFMEQSCPHPRLPPYISVHARTQSSPGASPPIALTIAQPTTLSRSPPSLTPLHRAFIDLQPHCTPHNAQQLTTCILLALATILPIHCHCQCPYARSTHSSQLAAWWPRSRNCPTYSLPHLFSFLIPHILMITIGRCLIILHQLLAYMPVYTMYPLHMR